MTTTLVRKVMPLVETYLTENSHPVGASYPLQCLEIVQHTKTAQRCTLQKLGQSILYGVFPFVVSRYFPEVIQSQHSMTVSPIFFTYEDTHLLTQPFLPSSLSIYNLGVQEGLDWRKTHCLFRRGTSSLERDMALIARFAIRDLRMHVQAAGNKRWRDG